ncbi:LYST [Cordylochernes scorpioides]|uniref:LYST n=1 Tax=Cordylochernes scorpioides TaxID=51811 RepID=A0ABY6LE08_9ARAC|nr:LYST [Cordylochernes scorpioides]
MYQLDAPLSPLTYHFAVLPERCTYWECQADLCKAHTIFPPSANNTQYAHFSDNTSTTQGLTQPPHHVQSKNFFRANCSYYRVKVPEQPPNANLSHPTKVQTDHLHHTPKHPHSTHHSMYHTHHPSSPEHLPGIPIDNQPQPPYPPQFPALLRQYQHVFSRNKFAVPCLKVPPVRIATNSDKVVTIRPYRVPICDQREIRSQIRQMLDNDIIEPSYSPFSSPVTLVTKRDKTKRFCIDYRKVNEVISSDVHPLPRIEDILDRLARAKYFSTADVSSAYWQVPIHPDSRPLLAFATIDGLYQPTRLPFGLKTSPQIYERAINQVLQGHGLDCVAHYFDDFVIYSETLEEHQEHLRRFFAFCDAENLQLNLTKCEFFRQTIEFLGYTITAGTTTPLIRNTDVIHAIPPPNNRKTLQSFLGAVNVYNKFIPDYARLRTPLNNLLKKDVTWDWDDKCQKAFTSLKESLTQHPVLHLYKDELPCQVYCDASTLGIAGVLKQVHSAGKAYPVQYFSRALRVHERNYTISELECLAIVESVEKFRVYLMGRKFTIFSDHHALQWLKTIKNPSGRLFRWSLRLSCYEYEVRYIKGALQHEADLLSRNPFCGFLDTTLIKNHQLTPSGESKLTIDRNGLQTLRRRGVTKIVVPDALVPDLLTKVHSRYNHPGISQMTRLISPQYYWKGMSEDISKTTKACAICQSTKPPRGPTFGELGQLPVATQPFDLVALDTIAGLAKYGNAKAYLHVVVDHFSRYTWTFPSKSTSLTTYQQVIKRVLQDGSPKRLLTDRAPAFTSPKFRKFLINRNIHPLLTTSNNPQANGLCERLNATLTGKLRLLHLENPKAAWTKLAKRVTVVYNNTPHSVTGFPPGYLMFGVLPPELTEHVNPYPVLTTARRIAHERTQAKHLKDKHAYDQQHKTPHFEPGDLVLVKVYHHPNTGKLAPYFTGPYEILEIISPNVVRINRPNQPLNRNTDTVHVNKLQYYNENIRYIAPPTLIPHPAKPQSRTLPPLFEHLTPDLFTVERFAPTIGNCTTTTPVDPQCNIIAQRDIPQPAISRPTHITKVKTPIPTVRADPKPIPLQARFFRNVKTFPLFHLLYLINLFILPTVLLPMATLLYVSVYTLQPNRLFQLQEALFEITIAVVELIHRTIGIILPELWTILVHSHALVALIGVLFRHVAPCVIITPSADVSGELLLGQQCLYFVGDSLKTQVDAESDPKLNATGESTLSQHVKELFSQAWPYTNIKEVLQRRYLLQECAIEIFLLSGITFLLTFESKEVRSCLRSVVPLFDTTIVSQVVETIWSHLALLYPPASHPSPTSAWRDHQLTNFQYLTQLNSLAGRSFNDIMQYPVFPFVLADYHSSQLDLSSPEVYRVLSANVPVQTKERERRFKANYEVGLTDMVNDPGLNPFSGHPYHFSSLYSNSGLVLQYLIRTLPFTYKFLKFQGHDNHDNNFDLPDRSFHSVELSWRVATRDSNSDVKEMIPEFFYFPEFLVNYNGLDLGVCQNGVQVDDVELPPWCHGNARIFTLVLRQALESSMVTNNLHHWIDLIFGYKQTGKAAVAALNVYHPLSNPTSECKQPNRGSGTFTYYEGAASINQGDELRQKAAHTMVRNLGQVPQQLFHTPHPMVTQWVVDSAAPTSSSLWVAGVTGLRWGNFPGSPAAPSPLVTSASLPGGPLGRMVALCNMDVFCVGPCSCLLLAHNSTKGLLNSTYVESAALIVWRHLDGVVRVKFYADQPYEPLLASSPYDKVCQCLSVPGSPLLFVGFSSGLVKVFTLAIDCPKAKIGQSKPSCTLIGHQAAISAIAICQEFKIAVTASQDGKLLVWDLNTLAYIHTISSHSSPVKLVAISPTLGDIASVSDIQGGSTLHLHTINGGQVGQASVEVPITSLCYSTLPEGTAINLIAVGLDNGTIRLYNSWTLEVVNHITSNIDSPIISLTYSQDNQHLLGATRDKVYTWEIPSRAPSSSRKPRLKSLHT